MHSKEGRDLFMLADDIIRATKDRKSLCGVTAYSGVHEKHDIPEECFDNTRFDTKPLSVAQAAAAEWLDDDNEWTSFHQERELDATSRIDRRKLK